MMKFKVKDMDIHTGGTLIAILNEKDARELDIYSSDRIVVKYGNRKITCILDISESKKWLGHKKNKKILLIRQSAEGGFLIDFKRQCC